MIVFDSSALLAILQNEPGEDVVTGFLKSSRPGVVGAANWAEIAQKSQRRSENWAASRALLMSYGLDVEPVTEHDAEHAAKRWTPGSGLSLADRLCLALGERLDAEVVTADTAWGSQGRVTQIR